MADGRDPLVITLRQESSVSREWGVLDTLLYNLMTMNFAVMFTVPFLAAVALYPRGDLPVAILIAGVLCCAEAVVYAFLASSVPRSGGDYFLQKRLVSQAIGKVFAFTGVVLGGALWMAIAGWFAANVAVGPLLTVVGRLTGHDAFLSCAALVRSSHGVFLLSLTVVIWSATVNIWGLRTYAILQRISWAVGAGALIFLALLVALLGADRVGSADLYTEALMRARALGFDPGAGSGAAMGTMALVPVAAFSLIYPAWSVQQVGEVRRASRLRSQLVTMVLAEALTAVFSAVVVALVLANVDRDGLAAGAYLFLFERSAMPDPNVPFYWFFDGSLWPSGSAVLALAVLFNAWFWMWVPDITLAASRVMLAMSSDRSLPAWLGDPWGRHRAPAKAIALFSAVCVVPAALYAYTPLWRLTLSVTLLNVLAFAVTCAGGACAPYTNREFYRESTAARFEILKVPLITWCGGGFCLFAAFLVWRFAVDAGLALGAPRWALFAFVAVTYVTAYLVQVLVTRFGGYRKGRGAEVIYRLTD